MKDMMKSGNSIYIDKEIGYLIFNVKYEKQRKHDKVIITPTLCSKYGWITTNISDIEGYKRIVGDFLGIPDGTYQIKKAANYEYIFKRNNI